MSGSRFKETRQESQEEIINRLESRSSKYGNASIGSEALAFFVGFVLAAGFVAANCFLFGAPLAITLGAAGIAGIIGAGAMLSANDIDQKRMGTLEDNRMEHPQSPDIKHYDNKSVIGKFIYRHQSKLKFITGIVAFGFTSIMLPFSMAGILGGGALVTKIIVAVHSLKIAGHAVMSFLPLEALGPVMSLIPFAIGFGFAKLTQAIRKAMTPPKPPGERVLAVDVNILRHLQAARRNDKEQQNTNNLSNETGTPKRTNQVTQGNSDVAPVDAALLTTGKPSETQVAQGSDSAAPPVNTAENPAAGPERRDGVDNILWL